MTRRCRQTLVWMLMLSILVTGCQPMQPYYLRENCELAEYLEVATEMEYPDVCEQPLDEVVGAYEPQTVAHPDFDSIWELSLEEAIHTALHNAKIVRDLGAVRQFGQVLANFPERLTGAPQAVATIYDVAIQETAQNGVEQVLSRFDAIFNSRATWDSTDRIQNFVPGNTVNALVFQQDQVNITNELSKLTAGGAQLFLRNVSIYTGANNVLTSMTRGVNSDWFTAIEGEIRQPLLRGRGAQVNRAGVVIARMRSDQAIIDFETQVYQLLNTIETAYWGLYFFYHNLDAARIGRDTAYGIWQRIRALREEGISRGDAAAEAQAREQYFFFRNRMHESIRDIQKAQTRLRYLMGLTPNDGRMIRPCDDPTTAWLRFDWCTILEEAVVRRPEIRREKWAIKQRELELIAAKNQLLPQFDAIALYRWLGVGDEFRSNAPGTPIPPTTLEFPAGALDELLGGDFQEFRLGFEFELPVGMRAAMAQVRNQQLQLAREKARLEDMELEVTHQLDDAVKDLDAGYQALLDTLDRLNAAEENVTAANTEYEAGAATLDLLLDAHRRRAEAAIAYNQSLVTYNLAVMNVHFRKGSLADYDNVIMAEGPWPAKAYFDATNRARQRSASHYLNYGFSRPRVVSRGPVEANIPESMPPVAFGDGEAHLEPEALESEVIEPQPYETYPESDLDSLERVPSGDNYEGSGSRNDVWDDGFDPSLPQIESGPSLEPRPTDARPPSSQEQLPDSIETGLGAGTIRLVPPTESVFEPQKRVADDAGKIKRTAYLEPQGAQSQTNFFDSTLDADDTTVRASLRPGVEIRWK